MALGTQRGREDCVEVDTNRAITIFYRNQKCRNGRTEYEEFQIHSPPTWQPKCVVILIEQESRAALRDSLIEQGRILVNPLRIELNYTTAQSDNPDLAVASSNCALGHFLKNLHEHDLAGQEARDKLLSLKRELVTAREQQILFNRIYLGYVHTFIPRFERHTHTYLPLCVCTLSRVQSLCVQATKLATAALRTTRRRQRATRSSSTSLPCNAQRAAARTRRVARAGGCRGKRCHRVVHSVDHKHMRSIVATGAQPVDFQGRNTMRGCRHVRGFGRHVLWLLGLHCKLNPFLECSLCRYTAHLFPSRSQVNPDAADSEEAAELLSEDGAPYCFSSEGTALKCPVTADRTNRAGIYELEVSALPVHHTSTLLTF